MLELCFICVRVSFFKFAGDRNRTEDTENSSHNWMSFWGKLCFACGSVFVALER